MSEEPSIVREMRILEKNHLPQATQPFEEVMNECACSQSTSMSLEQSENHHMLPDELPKNQDFYKMLIDTIIEGILILDFNGIILFANRALANMLGLSNPDEAIGKNVLDFVEKTYHKQVIKDQLLIRMGKGGFLNSYQINTMKGKKIWVEGIGCLIDYNGKKSNVVFLRNITDRLKMWESMKKLEKKYRAIAEMSAEGILTLDTMGSIRYVNPSFQSITKYKEPVLIGKVFRELLDDESIYPFQQLLLDVRKKSGSIKHVELDILNSEDQLVPIELSIAPLIKDNLLQGFVCTVHDITNRKKMEEEKRKSEQLKTEFMNIAAHELKSPVTPIKGYLDLILSDEKTDEQIKKWAQVSLRNAERLLTLVNDILDISRLDNDTMSFEMKKFDSTNLLEEIVEDMKPSIEQKNLIFSVSIPEKLPDIFGDFCRLQQVFKNIFTNAIKFTEEGSISLLAAVETNHLIISISDTGVGIDSDELDNIFEKFYQADTGESRKHEGTGLGLFICREIIRKHKGSIAVRSVPGEGTTFTITLPILETRT
ncbi:MAG: PAS domain-containing sensor histidine kinase [Candidatus Thermoplasmatota archaeon]|nr:PAS domain-containing sensor histidine kinase [Candidatus Thermoplasmatota archaeon]